MDKNWRRLLHEEMERDADRIMEEVNSDPNVRDAVAPEEIHDKLFQRIREHEEERSSSVLSAEEQELIRLGKVYKKKRKWNKYIILVAALVGAMAFSLTSMGGPRGLVEKVRRMVAGREQTKINVDDGRIQSVENTAEADAYAQIEDAFGVFPVRFYYLPDGMIFTEHVIEKETQNARMYFEHGTEKMLCCTMWFHSQAASTIVDIEDEIVQEYQTEVDGNFVHVKQYVVDDSDIARWRIEFQHSDVQYFIVVTGFTEAEVQETVQNLKFSK